MKKILVYTSQLLVLIYCTMGVGHAATEKFTLDEKHSYILWHINHFGFTSQAGKWYASGELLLDKDKPQNSKVNATIKVADVVTGIPELDKHLRGKLFFNTEQYPTATFVSDKVEVTGKTSAIVTGVLTVKGVSKVIAMDVTLNQSGINPINEKYTVGLSSTTKLKRSDFGIKTMVPGLGDEVKLHIEVEAYQANEQI